MQCVTYKLYPLRIYVHKKAEFGLRRHDMFCPLPVIEAICRNLCLFLVPVTPTTNSGLFEKN